MLGNIIKSFAKIGLPLVILGQPIRGANRRANHNIFQMDIERTIKHDNWRGERFRIFPGHKDNIVQIIDTDPKLKQLLLMVNEPIREYEDSQKVPRRQNIKEVIEQNKKFGFYGFKVSGDTLHYKGKTPGGKRFFLMGVDERQLFIAQLKGPAISMEAAFKSLGKTIEFADGKRGFKRQGEWIMLETDQTLRDMIETAIRKTQTSIRKKVNIGSVLGRSRGKPHVADELVVLPLGSKDSVGTSEFRLRRKRVFIRGCVRHLDHPTKRFSHWREVIENDEGATSQGGSSGIFWID
jgi:hypothetical protein